MKNLLLICGLFVATGCETTRTAVNLDAAQEVKTVAVLPFDLEAGLSPEAARDSEAFFAALLMQNGFKVVERERMGAILKEQALSASGLTGADTLKLGELAHADALLFGKVLKNQEGKKTVSETDSNGQSVEAQRRFYDFKLSVRLVRSQAGETVFSQVNQIAERVQDPKFIFPDDLSAWRAMVLDGMGRDLKKALKKKK
ncbi:MAG: hypothetical protein J0L75_03375 [Spirochaetes bacterium]|nr:hypothetical protein [Spirochaetota bacterium]